jgi:hypothetical protein
MIMMKLGNSFWQSVARGYAREQALLERDALFWVGKYAEVREGQPLRRKVRALYFDADRLASRIYLGASDGRDLAKHYWQLLRTHIMGVDATHLWNEMLGDEGKPWQAEENRRHLAGALRAGHVVGMFIGEPGIKDCLRAAVTLSYRVLSEGEFTKEVHSQDGKVDEEYLDAATMMMSLWLLNRDSAKVEDLWQTRMQSVGKTVASTRCYRFCHCLAELAKLGTCRNAEQAVAAEEALLDIQLLWLKWLAKEPLVDIRMLDLVIAELIFQEYSTGISCPVQEAFSRQQPEQVRERYERIIAA